MRSAPRSDAFVYLTCLGAMAALLWLNGRAQDIGLLSWANAALLGLASLIAGLSYGLTHLLRGGLSAPGRRRPGGGPRRSDRGQ